MPEAGRGLRHYERRPRLRRDLRALAGGAAARVVAEQPRQPAVADAGAQHAVVGARVAPPRGQQLARALRLDVEEQAYPLPVGSAAAELARGRVAAVGVVDHEIGAQHSGVALLEPVPGPLLVLARGQIGAKPPLRPQRAAEGAGVARIPPSRKRAVE